MRRGRPRVGVRLVDRLDAPRGAHRRVRVILATLTGQQTVAEACAALGVGRARFHALRQQVLHGALDAVHTRAPGRPRTRAKPGDDVVALQRRIRELELALRATQLRSEIALTMPFLLERAARKKKHTRQPRASAARPRRAGGTGARRRQS